MYIKIRYQYYKIKHLTMKTIERSININIRYLFVKFDLL